MSVFSSYVSSNPPPLGDVEKARSWYYMQSRKIGNLNPRDILRQTTSRDNLRAFVRPGMLYMFFYTPKNATTLPYYDRFPLVFPFNVTDKGFTGINMHYLPPIYRALLMDGLSQFIIPNQDEDLVRIRLSYDMLASMSRLRYFKPAVKQYLNNFVRSRFLLVPSSEWNMALMLPLERFAKKSVDTVFRDSRQVVRSTPRR